MANKAIIYGDILGEDNRREFEKRHQARAECLTWHNDATLFKAADDLSLILVDLDDPRFSRAEFLFSLATGARGAKLVGRATDPDLETLRKVSKYGIAEVLDSSQCLERLHEFLGELEDEVTETSGTPSRFGVDALLGDSPQINDIKATIQLLSEVDFPSALVLGETGTGKSLIAKILHNSGLRAESNLVEVNCSSISDELFESELFGHVRGAFTDAKADKMGLFEYAEKGTLFLDEVGNLSQSAQAKLLKILEDKKLRKVGDVSERDIDVRVVAATNLKLEAAIEDKKFRDDLFFRLNLLTIEIPPLRERPEDIPAIVAHYLAYYTTLYGKPELKIGEKTLSHLTEYHWPGNVRELCNVIERAVLLARGTTIKPADVKQALKNGRVSAADRRQIVIDVPVQGLALDEIEQDIVKQVLNMCNWNKTEAARFLNVSRPRLRRILQTSGLEQNRRKD